MRKEYTKDGVTVVWQPGKCIHSKNCFNGLSEVFNPQVKPWINMEGASIDSIMDQVDKCPSGALSYYFGEDKDSGPIASDRGITKITVKPDGPLLVSGRVTIEHRDGKMERKNVAALCRCGHSANKPYCDGSHMREDFKG